ncbi:MAG: hypothetical protein HMLKMBBP_03153 [Planctomycetes bacterium]|nr:hypothetical protein [Planctomycetota bacterium]
MELGGIQDAQIGDAAVTLEVSDLKKADLEKIRKFLGDNGFTLTPAMKQ